MFKLLNRFAWILSIVFWFIVSFFLIGLDGGTIRGEDIFFSAFWWIWLWLVIKKLLFSENFITSRLQYFQSRLIENIWKTKNTVIDNMVTQDFSDSTSSSFSNEEISSSIDNRDSDYTSVTQIWDSWLEVISNKKQVEEKPSNQLNYSISKEEEKIEKIEEAPWILDIYIEKTIDYIKEFFSTNTLAKIWAILIFLAVVFFLRWIAETFWEVIGPVWRLLIGFVIAFWIFWTWSIVYARWNKNEGLILIGLWILINYGVILSWRYLIWESSLWEDWFLTEGITFLLLIFNTVLWVVTSLVYQSRTLLIFSFVFAYINPFIIWANSSGTPYTLVWYSLIVSLGGLFLAQKASTKTLVEQEINCNNYNILLYLTFILWNLLILVAPFTTDIDWIIKIVSTVVLTALTIYTFWNAQLDKKSRLQLWVTWLFIIWYFFLVLQLMVGGFYNWILDTGLSFIIYATVLVVFFWFSSILFKKDSENPILQFLLFVPLLICLSIIITWQAFSVVWLLAVILWLYLISFSHLKQKFSTSLSYCYFILIWIFILISDISIVLNYNVLDLKVFLTLLVVSFIFLFSTYYYSLEKYLSHLYSIGTIFVISILVPIIVVKSTIAGLQPWEIISSWTISTQTHVYLSVVSIIIFALANWILPFINNNLLKNPKNITNLVIWSLAWVLFIAFEIYNFWNEYFEWVAQWIAFLALAIVYFVQSFFIVQRIGNLQEITSWDNSSDKVSLKNVFYTYAWITLSLFSLAIAFLFSKYPEIISTVWLFEATILYYFYSQTKQWKVLIAGNVLFIIWILKLATLATLVSSGDFMFLVSFSVILISLLLNIWFIDKQNDIVWKNIHYIAHIIWIWILGGLLSKIIVSTWNWWSTLWISVFVTLIGIVYSKLKTDFLKWFFVILLICFSVFHIIWINLIFWQLEYREMNYLKILQYLVTGAIIWNYVIWNKKINAEYKDLIWTIIWIYVFIISNIYVLDIFGGIFWHFSLTIYWWIIASILLFYWIAKDIIKLRTAGLYFIILTSIKAFWFDVWQLDNTSSRVIAFMWLGILFIVISTLYTKKYWNNILSELSPENLKDTPWEEPTENVLLDTDSEKNINTTESKSTEKEVTKTDKKQTKKSNTKTSENSNTDESPRDYSENEFMKKLKKVDVDDIKVVRFSPNTLDNFTIRAKNLMRISKLVIKQTGKNTFKWWELEGIYNYVIKNYKSKLSRREFDKLRSTLKDFIDDGWEVEIVKK